MIIDVHTHLFEHYEYLEGLRIDALVQNMDAAGVDKAVLFTVDGLLGGMNGGDYRRSNDEIVAAASKYPERLIPFGSVNPRDGDVALAEMERAVNDLGVKGFKLHPWWSNFTASSPIARDVAVQGSALRTRFIIHSGTPPTSTPLQIAEMARVAPDASFMLAHMGLADLWKEALRAGARYENIFLETTGAHSLAISHAVRTVGAKRVVYGSDMPFGGRDNVHFQIQKIRDLRLSSEDEADILGANAARLLDVA